VYVFIFSVKIKKTSPIKGKKEAKKEIQMRETNILCWQKHGFYIQCGKHIFNCWIRY